MSKSNENAARDSAGQLKQQAKDTLGPIAQQKSDQSNAAYGAATGNLNQSSSAYGKMAETGGFSDADKTSYLNRATEAQDSASEALQNQARLSAAKTGQNNPQAAISRISRQLSQGKAQSLNDAQVGLNQQQNFNKLQGAGGLSQVGGQFSNMGSQTAQQQMAALGLQFNTEAEAQNALDQLSHNKGIFDNVMSVGQLATGAIGALKPNGI